MRRHLTLILILAAPCSASADDVEARRVRHLDALHQRLTACGDDAVREWQSGELPGAEDSTESYHYLVRRGRQILRERGCL